MAFVSWESVYGTTTSTDDVLIDSGQEIEISSDVAVATIDIQNGGKLRFAPGANVRLSCHGNIHAQHVGTLLQLRPSIGFTHTIVFEGIDVQQFVGTSTPIDHSFQATDRGLWIRHGAAIDAGDARDRLPWTTLTGGATAGATTITLSDLPTGWQVGDRIVITPTESPAVDPTDYWQQYDERTVSAISGKTITLSAPLTYSHPATTADPDVIPLDWTQPTTWTAEVLNLTRDVKFQGTPSGNGHVMVHSTAVQYLKNVEIRYMGVRKKVTTTDWQGVEGRYALHMHHGLYCDGYETGARHTTENITISDGGFRGFVVHNTHGVTLEKCVSHNTFGEAYWWDINLSKGNHQDPAFLGNETNDLHWSHCVASWVRTAPGLTQYRLAGFSLADGNNITVENCIAVGIGGQLNSAGFIWPEGAQSVWTHQNNTSHNCKRNGIFVWQNNNFLHEILDFTAYNVASAIDHGAYNNSYRYTRLLAVGCIQAAVNLHASSNLRIRQHFHHVGVDGQGFGNHAFNFLHPNIAPTSETDAYDWKIKNLGPINPLNGDGYLIKINDGVGIKPNRAYLRNWQVLDNSTTPESIIWWQSDYVSNDNLKIRNLTLNGIDQGYFDVFHPSAPEGIAVAEWNYAKRLTMSSDDWDSDDDGSIETFLETFEGNDQTGWPNWTIVSSNAATASVVSNKGALTTQQTFNSHIKLEPNSPGIVSDEDCQISTVFEYSAVSPGSFTASISLRSSGTDSNVTGYVMSIRNTSNVTVQEMRDGTSVNTFASFSSNITPAPGVRMRAKLRIQDGNILARIWQDGVAEPQIWTCNKPLTNPIVTGSPRVSMVRGSSDHTIYMDEIRIANFPVPDKEQFLRYESDPSAIAFSPYTNNLSLALSQIDDGPAAAIEIQSAPSWVSLSQTTFTLPHTVSVTSNIGLIPNGVSDSARIIFVSITHGSIEVPVSITTLNNQPVNCWVKTDSGLVAISNIIQV